MSKEFRFVHELIDKYAEYYGVQASTVDGYWRHMGIYDYLVMEYKNLVEMSFEDIVENINRLILNNGWSYSVQYNNI